MAVSYGAPSSSAAPWTALSKFCPAFNAGDTIVSDGALLLRVGGRADPDAQPHSHHCSVFGR